ncbi:MAG: RNA polymerase sigma factor [Planctomycetota bacterium]|nr:RNA polymerase sigma factor [Planctomycetota bacterium]
MRDHWRAQGTRRTQQGLEEVSDSLPSMIVESDNSMERKETVASLRQAIYKLPMAVRSVLLLRTYDELSFVQIARMLEVTPGAARKRYSRALAELRDSLPIQYGDINVTASLA